MVINGSIILESDENMKLNKLKPWVKHLLSGLYYLNKHVLNDHRSLFLNAEYSYYGRKTHFATRSLRLACKD